MSGPKECCSETKCSPTELALEVVSEWEIEHCCGHCLLNEAAAYPLAVREESGGRGCKERGGDTKEEMDF